MRKLTIVDTFGFLFRNYFALPNLNNSKGFPTGMLTGFANFIYSLKDEFSTDYIMFALDSKGKTFRHEIDPNYKANRKEPPKDLLTQLPVAINWVEKMGFKAYQESGFEADDIIASSVKFAKKYDIKVQIITHDKDLYQLIEDDKVFILDPTKKMIIDEKGCIEKFGVAPSLVLDYLSLVGDSADNIPGVKGIGPKGAKTLLDEFNSLEEIYENIEKINNPRRKELLLEGKESAYISKKLASLDDSLDISDRFESFLFPNEDPLVKIKDELEEYELRRILRRVEGSPLSIKNDEKNDSFKYILIKNDDELKKIISSINEDELIAFDTETDGLDTTKAKIVGFSFAKDENKAYYAPIAHNYLGVPNQISKECAKWAIGEIYKKRVVGQNIKFDFKIILNNFGLTPPIPYADTMILAWLLEPGKPVGLDALAKRFFNHEMIPFNKTIKKGESFANVDLELATKYAAEDALMTLKLYNELILKLDPIMLDLAKKVENPFILTLAKMENEGVKIDKRFLQNLLEDSENRLLKLTKSIYETSGAEFNINSFKQLGTVLFETLGLPPSKKTKSGYSTDESVLEGLKKKHPVIELVLEYRELYKLKSTYIEPLLKLSKTDKNSRVHTNFLQTGTSTGRLSSKEPNLQNIPVRTELGRAVRKGFIAKDGYSLVGIDYSQIELRLLAHFSEDEELVAAFKANKDIHKQTAIKLFGEEEASLKRAVAKTINFGLLYGMGARKLAQTLEIDTKEAKGYMDSYFSLFPSVKDYFQKVILESKKDGFVSTLLGRRRYFDYANATPMLLASYEREAVNTVFQGSAADLIKLAMLKLDEILSEDALLLLQIHDELIFEVKNEIASEFAQKAKELMEGIYKLNIPLVASVAIGKNWGELK